METSEIIALQNLADVSNLKVHLSYTQDKRQTVKKYFATINGTTVSPVLDYDKLNHLLLGWMKSNKKDGYDTLLEENKRLKDALKTLLSSYKADFKNITGADLNDTEAVKLAKSVLNQSAVKKDGNNDKAKKWWHILPYTKKRWYAEMYCDCSGAIDPAIFMDDENIERIYNDNCLSTTQQKKPNKLLEGLDNG